MINFSFLDIVLANMALSKELSPNKPTTSDPVDLLPSYIIPQALLNKVNTDNTCMNTIQPKSFLFF